MEADVILLDISLGDTTGFEVAERLRESGSKARIVFLSVHENPAFVQAGMQHGAYGYVFKSNISRDSGQGHQCGLSRRAFHSAQRPVAIQAIRATQTGFVLQYCKFRERATFRDTQIVDSLSPISYGANKIGARRRRLVTLVFRLFL